MTPSFDKRDLLQLADVQPGPCASLYMSAHKAFSERRQDRNRFKNLLRAVQGELESLGSRSTAVDAVLDPARALLLDEPFWGRTGDGLAAFFAADFARTYWLPLQVEELASVAGCFHVKPMLPLLSGDGRFFVLALSQNRVRLLSGTRSGIVELEPDGLPKSLAAALWADDPERSLQLHTISPRPQQSPSAVFHGQGGPDDKRKDELLRYFRSIDRPLNAHLREHDAPLVIAGVDYYLPIYREANTYPGLVDAVIPGNPEMLTPEQLHRDAWSIVGAKFTADETAAEARFRALAGTGRTTTELDKVLEAARIGQVETLFVALDQHCWSAAANGAPVRDAGGKSRAPGDVDLLDRAAVAALHNGGIVFARRASEMPQGTAVAAVLRY